MGGFLLVASSLTLTLYVQLLAPLVTQQLATL
jgi:hypothetical protein